jgi:hypothetical protein
MNKTENILLVILIISFLSISCGSSGTYIDYTKWKHYSINARTADDPLFLKLQKEFGIDPPLGSFYIEVNLTNPRYEFAQIGKGDGAKRLLWQSLTTETRKFITNWEYYKENLSE